MKLERTRASEVRPAMAMPECSSTVKIFFWYEDSSSALRYRGKNGMLASCAWWQTSTI